MVAATICFLTASMRSWSRPAPDAAEAHVTRRRVDSLRVPCRRPVAAAVVGRAKVRAALDHLAWNPDVGLARVIARTFGPAARILRDATRLRRVGLVLLRKPVGRPFPDIADHVVDAVAVGREGRDRRGTVEAVLAQVLAGKI